MALHLGCGGIGVVQHAAVRAYQRHTQAVLPQHGLFAGQHSTFGGQQVRADDYMTKPFGVMELISRVKALLRRAGGEEKLLSCGEVVMDETARRVTVGGAPCELTYKEYELLKYMLANAGLVLRREAILERVWGTDYEGESRTLDMHIKTLRQKLGSAGAHIRTVRSVGYSFEKEQAP